MEQRWSIRRPQRLIIGLAVITLGLVLASCVVEKGGGGTGGGCKVDFTTFTQGGWGSDCDGNNPGCIRDKHFDSVFPNGLVVGGTFTITLTSANAVRVFLPQEGKPAPLTQDHIDPLATEGGNLAGQVVAVTLAVEFDAAGVLTTSGQGCALLGDLIVEEGVCAEMTVSEVLAEGNAILGGDGGALTPSEIDECLQRINANFVDCKRDSGYLRCP